MSQYEIKLDTEEKFVTYHVEADSPEDAVAGIVDELQGVPIASVTEVE